MMWGFLILSLLILKCCSGKSEPQKEPRKWSALPEEERQDILRMVSSMTAEHIFLEMIKEEERQIT